MEWQSTPYVIPSVVAAASSLAMAPLAFRRRPALGATAFFWVCLAAGWWSSFQALGISAADLPTKLLMARIQYLGVVGVPLGWAVFALGYSGLGSWLARPGLRALLLVMPLTTLALAWTNERHHLIWARVGLAPSAPFAALEVVHGPWFLLNAAYTYALVVAATLLTLWTLSQSPHQRRQVAGVAIAPLIVMGMNALWLSPLNPSPFMDLTPMGFAFAAVAIGSSLFRYRLFDLGPVARSVIVDGLNDGVLVVDEHGAVADCNPAACRILGKPDGELVGASLRAVLPLLPSPPRVPREEQRSEIVLATAEGPRSYELGVTPLLHPAGALAGHLLVLHDTTVRRQTEQRLLQAQEELQRANADLRRLANTDTLTGLGSRRYFFERLGQELARAQRHARPLSTLMLDLDHFKAVNDTYGHEVGDRVLMAVARTLQSVKRESDIAGRLGGEEFALILPDTDEAGALLLGERLLERLRSLTHRSDDGRSFRLTGSAGVASVEGPLCGASELLSRADAGLYRAKALGRDQLSLGTPSHAA